MYKKDNPYCISINECNNYFNKSVDILVLVEKVKEINTKKGDKMAFITGSDETGSKELIMFPKVYINSNVEVGNIIKIRGKVEKRFDEYQIIVDKIKILQGEKNEKDSENI